MGGDHVEPAGRIGMAWMRREELLRGTHQPLALAAIHRGRAATEGCMFPVAHFDKHHAVAVLHHQIQLAATLLCIAFQQPQPA